MGGLFEFEKLIKCSLILDDREGGEVFVEVMPIANLAPAGPDTIFPCRWKGATKRRLCQENGWRADFAIFARMEGFFKIKGFRCATKSDMSDAQFVKVAHVFRVARRQARSVSGPVRGS
jgi:hypothetical protein